MPAGDPPIVSALSIRIYNLNVYVLYLRADAEKRAYRVMLFILTGIVFILCIYAVFTYARQAVILESTMLPKSQQTVTRSVADITNDDSDLMTEQSSVSDMTGDDDAEKVIPESDESCSDLESQAEKVDYTQMKIEEPPSFFNSQTPKPRRDLRHYFKATHTTDDDDEEDDGEFMKKVEKAKLNAGFSSQSFASDDQASSSSAGSQSQRRRNRKARKERKPRNRASAKEDGKSIFNWKGKVELADEKRALPGVSGSNVDQIAPKTSDTDDVEFVSDSRDPSTCTATSDVPSRKRLRHVTISAEKEEVHHELLKIAGVDVKFPVKPYPSQIAVMNKLIQGCKKEEHCLLESPTGSGKTLALLCGVLAWQEHIKDELRAQQIAEKGENPENEITVPKIEGKDAAEAQDAKPKSNCCSCGTKTEAEGAAAVAQDDESSCCITNSNCAKTEECTKISDDEQTHPPKKMCRSTSPTPAFLEELNNLFPAERPKRAPTVYYGSRTHKQIEQLIREFKKTAYAFKKMTILSSREFTCIQPKDENKTELCAKLLDPVKGSGCRYYSEKSRSRISSNLALNSFGINGPWDIEDLVELGRQESSCPYFAARDLMMEADIVFCPYNYLVDPNIRQSMQINLDGQVVILDEAHNIEEMSREVGSLYFREDKVMEVVVECEILCQKRKHDEKTYRVIKTYLNNLVEFMKNCELNNIDKFSDTASSEFWTGVELCEMFNMNTLGKGAAKSFEVAAAAAIMDFNTAKEENSKKQQDSAPSPVITSTAKKFLEDLLLALQMMMSEKLANDYRACVIETEVRDSRFVPDGQWHTRNSSKRLRTIQMLCMNPAVIFSPLAVMARCVVLASGTLSPVSSFQSELGTAFPHKLDANHVVPKENVYIRGIPCGPTGVQLKANYSNVNAYVFQDELGKLIVDVCRVVPHGVLCFFSSYSMMQKQIDRWKQNKCWNELQKVKHILQEPRGSSNLEPVMQEFRDIIQKTSEGSQNGITGVLLLAVFRGKVAEGIDFSDNEARCVMAVGIPFAVRKDPSVDMKFTYNNLNHAKGLLKGGEWYAVQAFRALNQALGRCVRHRNDWGAVLLIDQRFLERTNYNYLPKWVKTMWRDSIHYNLNEELRQFVARQLDRDKEKKLDSAGPQVPTV